MNVKISWYREVLELEPDSRLFYPLARLLAEEGELDEACAVLARGLERHPGYLEARLYYVELLRELHRTEESSRELELLAPVFARHSGFWQAWAATAATGGALDSALALRLMGLFVQGVQVDLSDLLRRGLDSLEAELGLGTIKAHKAPLPAAETSGNSFDAALHVPHQAHPQAHALATPETSATSAASAASADAASSRPNPLASIQAAAATLAAPVVSAHNSGAAPVQAASPSSGLSSETSFRSSAQASAGDVILLKNRIEPAASADSADPVDEDAGLDTGPATGTWPPRTRSMAEVLAEQGEYAEAMDIYDELLARCRNVKQRQELENRRRELEALARGRGTGEAQADEVDDADDTDRDTLSAESATRAGSAQTAAPLKAEASSLPGRELISMLETLADRVEARIR